MVSAFYHTFPKDQEPCDIERNEAEAGSILASLVSQDRSSSIQGGRKSMSIRNLLDLNEKREERESITSYHGSTEAYCYPHRSSISENQLDGYSAPSTPPTCSSYIPYDSSSRKVLMDNKYQTYFRHFPTPETKDLHTLTSPKIEKRATQRKQKEYKNTQHSHMIHRQKVRRNALQVYISYMIYADMKCKRTKQQHDQQAPNSIIEQPLTAFLHQPSINTHLKKTE
ncbi:unnamed protein product [Rhizopus stolonifer]